MALAPVIALSHGGGPLPLLNDPDHADIIKSLKTRIPKLLDLKGPRRPRAIVLVTAHWSTAEPTISSGARHELLYDYYGFPPQTYELDYPAPGDPQVAAEVAEALRAEGFSGNHSVTLDADRGWDHGVFVPLMLALPDADVPIVQMSVLESEDPERHLRMGRALQSLRAKNVAVIGSGFASFHNLRLLMGFRQGAGVTAEGRAVLTASQGWNAALNEAVGADQGERRWEGLKGWRKLPSADLMHPPRGGEHFMPLIVCTGAATDDEKTRKYKDSFIGFDIFTYYWGADEVD